MAGKPDKSEDSGAENPVKSGGGMIGIIVMAVAALATSFGTAYFLSPAEPAHAVMACEPGETEAHIKPMVKGDQAYVELPEVLITIGSAPATRYLKMNISIVTPKGETGKIKTAEPVLIDAFINYLRSVEMADFEDPAFYARMREQLSRRAELVLGSEVSQGVLITEFLLR